MTHFDQHSLGVLDKKYELGVSKHTYSMLVSAYIDENGELNILQRKGLCHALVAGATGCGKSMRYLDSFPIGLSRSCKLIEWMMNNRYISMCGGYYKVLITREEFEKLYGDAHYADDDEAEDLYIDAKNSEQEKFLEQHFFEDGSDDEGEKDDVYKIISRIFHSDVDESDDI